MNIGIILDGVLTNLEQFQFDYGSKFYFEQEMQLKNPRGCTVQEIYHRHGNYARKGVRGKTFWEMYSKYYLSRIPPRPFASEVILKLHEHGHKIFLLCTRTYALHSLSEEEIIRLTKLWLIEHGIYFDFLIFSDIINVDLMKKYQISLLLDHHPESIFEISFHLPVVCFHAKYNEGCKADNIYRVYSWYDFYEKMDVIEEQEFVSQR